MVDIVPSQRLHGQPEHGTLSTQVQVLELPQTWKSTQESSWCKWGLNGIRAQRRRRKGLEYKSNSPETVPEAPLLYIS